MTGGTAKTHLARAREKLGVDTSREVTALLLHEGVVKPEDFLAPGYLQPGSGVPAVSCVNRSATKDQPMAHKKSTIG